MACRTYFGIIAVITIGAVVFGYSYAEQKREMLIQGKIGQLTEVAACIEQRLDRREFDQAAKLAGRDEALVNSLNRQYQALLDDVRQWYPAYELGLYSLEMGRTVAVSPAVSALHSGPPGTQVWRVYQTGKTEIDYISALVGGEVISALTVEYPIFLDGKLVGHTWSSISLADVERDSLYTVGRGVSLAAVLWLAALLVISIVFGNMVVAFRKVAKQIGREDFNPATLLDFPELMPGLAVLAGTSKHPFAEIDMVRQLIDLCPVGILIIDRTATVVTVNQRLRQIYPPPLNDDPIGKSLQVISELAGYPLEQSVAWRALHGEIVQGQYMLAFGREWLANARPLTTASGELIGAMAVTQDITEYEKLRNEMNAIERDYLVSNMATGVAHEIRNPLTVVKGYLQFFRKKPVTFEAIDLILREIERVEAIVTDFLTLACNKNTEKVRQNLNDLIRQAAPQMDDEALNRALIFRLNLAKDLPDLLLDGKEIYQLISNLVHNGFEAISAGGEVVISTSNDEAAVWLRVTDNGCGISGQAVTKIFDPFYTTKTSGTGLGLAVVASIVRRHGGTVETHSEEGRGTSIVIRFPRADLEV